MRLCDTSGAYNPQFLHKEIQDEYETNRDKAKVVPSEGEKYLVLQLCHK